MSNQADKLSRRTRWVMRRNAVLGNAGFQRWASRTPIVRYVAQNKASAHFDLIAGFVYSQILSAFVESGLIEYLNGRLRGADEIADFAGLSPAATQRLLQASQSLEIAESPQDGLWTLGQVGAALSANQGAIAMIRHHNLLYQDMAEPLTLLASDRQKATRLSAYWAYAEHAGNGDVASDYSALMAETQPMVTEQIIEAYRFSRHSRMLDIGGGSGAFARAVAAAAQHLQIGIFDLPDVVAEARLHRPVGTAADRIRFHPGNFKYDLLPKGYDLITLVRILHDHDDEVAVVLLAKIYAALPIGGRLLIVEPMAKCKTAPRMGDAYFGLYLWAMGSGRPRSKKEISNLLKSAGFQWVRELHTALPIITSAVVATK